MANDKSRKKHNSDKPPMKKSAVSGSCKPCMPVERNGTNKEKSASIKNPPVNEISNVNSCYEKCSSLSKQKDSSSTSYKEVKSTVKPLDQTTSVGSCYAKCGPPSVQQTSSSTSNGSTSSTSKPDQLEIQTQRVDSVIGSCEFKPLNITNPFIEKMDEDILYHIALGNKSHDLVKMFGDVKFVVMGSTPKRMEQFAYFMANQLKYELPPGTVLNDISKNSHRYAMYKVGPILSVSHGMGTPSIGILLHELIKLMSHAGVKDPIFVKIGTCGGFNKKAGTVVVSNKVVNDFMEPFYELAILGKKVRFPANLDQAVVNEILSSSKLEDKFETIAGATYCTDNFYEGSGRSDGAICEFSQQEGLEYYKKLQQKGVANVEMESLAFAALTCRAGIKSAVVTVILSDRLKTDQIKQSKEALDEWQNRPQRVLANYIKKNLSINDLSESTRDSTWISTTKIPTSRTTPGAMTTCKSCGGTGSSTDTPSAENTTSAIPTMTTGRNLKTTRCESCADRAINKTDTTKSTSSSLDPITGKSCGGFGKDLPSSTGGTSSATKSTTSTTSAAPTPCKSCGGAGIKTQSSSDTSTLKPTDLAYSTTHAGAGKSADNSTTKKSVDFTSTTASSDSTICKPCQSIGKSKTANDVTIPSSQSHSSSGILSPGPASSGSTFGTSPSTMKPTTAPCKSCLGSGKTNESNTTMQSKISTTRSPDMMVCKCCGGAGVVPNTMTNDDSIPTLKPSSATGTSQSNPSCKPCLNLSSKQNQTATSSTATPQMEYSSSAAPKSANENPLNICKPCTTGGSTSVPGSRDSTTSSPSFPTGTGGRNTSTTASGLATSAPNVSGSNVCKPCSSIGSSNTAPETNTSAPFQRSNSSQKPTIGKIPPPINDISKDSSSESTTKCSAYASKPSAGSTFLGTAGTSTTAKPTGTGTTSQSDLSATKGVCKPCGGSANNSNNAAVGPTTSAPNSTTKVPQSGSSTTDPSKQNAGSRTSSTTTSGTSTAKPGNGSTTTASHSGLSSEKPRKQNGGKTTCGISTCKLGSNPPTSLSGYSNGGGSTAGVTAGTKIPSTANTTAQSSFSIEELCKRNRENTPLGTTRGTSTCKPGNNPPASSRNGSCNNEIRKPSSNGTSTDRPRDSTTNAPDFSTAASSATPFGVCKPCSAGRMDETSGGIRTTPAANPSKSTSRAELAANENRTAVATGEISKSTCKRSTTTFQPTTDSSTFKANLNSTTASNGTGTAAAEPKRSKCVPYTCYTADKTDTTPLPTTPKAYLAKDFDSSSNSTISNDSWRSCYQKCSSKRLSSEGRALSSSKPPTFQTPEQDNMKGVPPALGPCCSSTDTVEFREVPKVKGTTCAMCEEKKDLNGESVKNKSSAERRPSMGHIKTDSSAKRCPLADQEKNESSRERRPSMGNVIKTKSPIDRRPSMGKISTNSPSSSERRPSMGQMKAKSVLANPPKLPSFDSTTPPSKSGHCGGGSSGGVVSNPIYSASKSTGGLCLGNVDDSPDEPCVPREKSQVKDSGGTDSKRTSSLRSEHENVKLDEQHDGSKKLQASSDSKTVTQSTASVPYMGNIQGCPISIRGPCIYTKDGGQAQSQGSSISKPNADLCSTSTSTPKPSPDTPDTTTIRPMPDFVTPTPPSSKGIVCYSKFTNSNGVLVTSSINKENNEYDESPSPCAACKKYQENKTKSAKSTPADSQSEIIKCPHKLKRLKDECQGYD